MHFQGIYEDVISSPKYPFFQVKNAASVRDIKPIDHNHSSVTPSVHVCVLKDTTNEPAKMGSFGLPKEDTKEKNENTLPATIAMPPDLQPESVPTRTASGSPLLNKPSTSLLAASSNKPAVEKKQLVDNSLLPKEKETINAAHSDILHTDQDEEGLNQSSTSILAAASNQPAVKAKKLLDNIQSDQEEEEFDVSMEFELPNEVSQSPASKSSISVVKKAVKQHRCY